MFTNVNSSKLRQDIVGNIDYLNFRTFKRYSAGINGHHS
jgi:hypothetical protein